MRDCRRAEIEILLGRPHTALRLLSEYGSSPFALLTGVTAARAHLALGELRQAQGHISRILNTPSTFIDRRLIVEALVCGAQIADRAADEGRAVDLLDRALRVADGEIVLPFVHAAEGLAALLDRHPTVAARWPARPPRPPVVAATARPGTGTLPHPLTAREEAVLRLMTTTMSTAEIAGELGVSVHTVKSHLASIYRKLSVRRRRQAVFRARELELL